MRAWACGERTIAAWWRPATGGLSSVYGLRPVRSRASSTRFTGLPIQRSALLIDPSLGQLDGVLVGLLPSRASLLVREDGLLGSAWPGLEDDPRPGHPSLGSQRLRVGSDQVLLIRNALRSEERRVGKECRSRWSPYH